MKVDQFKDYHWAWLEGHPWVTAEWLGEKLREGFHIHHIDGRKENNSIKNLLLIYGSDHMAFHNGGIPRPPNSSKKRAEKSRKIGRLIYEEFDPMSSWKKLGEKHGLYADQAMILARRYAKENNLPVLKMTPSTQRAEMKKQSAGCRKG